MLPNLLNDNNKKHLQTKTTLSGGWIWDDFGTIIIDRQDERDKFD